MAKLVIIGTSDDDFPFCDSSEPESEKAEFDDDPSDDAGSEDYPLHNDSGELATKLGGSKSVNWTVLDPFAVETYEYRSDYWIDEDHGRVCPNAHHIIPGGAALGKCDDLLKWMGDPAVMHKVTYPRKKGKDETKTIGRRTVKVKYLESKSGKPRKEKIASVVGEVYGAVSYNVNGNHNGIWLPSNNAISDWGKAKSYGRYTGKEAKSDQDWVHSNFGDEYANRAIVATKKKGKFRQFHDSHDPYSAKVEGKLSGLAQELDKKAVGCRAKSNCDGSEKDGKLKAPQRLARALRTLSEEVSAKLEGDPKSWKGDWVTSQRSKRFKKPT